ncbi:MAG: CcmD family protein [Thermonemataceae bacterium]
MNKTLNKVVSCLLVGLLGSQQALAQQEPSDLEMFFRTDEKFYVVIAIIAVILLGMLIFVIRLDRKIAKIEKDLDN